MNIIEWRNTLCQDQDASPRGKHIGLTLSLFYRDGKRTYPTIGTLCDWSSTTSNTVSNAIKDLVALGYLEKKSFRFPNAKFTGTEYIFCGVSKGEQPSKIEGANEGAFQGAIESAIQPSKIEDKEEEIEEVEEKKKTIGDFDDFWNRYGKIGNKQQAKKSYEKSIKKGTNHEEIIHGLTNYQNYCRAIGQEQRYIKHASTWLNNKGWQDEYTIHQQQQPEQLSKHERAKKALGLA